MGNIALITGIAGQDGSYLAELLLNSGYEVHGLVRRNSVSEHQETRIDHIANEVKTYYADLVDLNGINRILDVTQPTHIFNLAAQSHVRISFEIPHFTGVVNGLGTLGILDSIVRQNAKCKFYQASSSEMFGDSVDGDGFQRESTPMHPVSPYGCAKLYAYHIVRNYRKSYGLFASNGILFNHESPRRGSNFVTSKIVKTAVLIKHGKAKKLELGNLDSYRDWGHSKDYVRAMKLILEHEFPDDFVVATGETRSVRDLVSLVFSKCGLNYEDYVSQNKLFMRPQELPYLKGDSTKVRTLLGWAPQVSFDELIDEMIELWESKITSE
jgi:GDPmannose 4,6-dehydratase